MCKLLEKSKWTKKSWLQYPTPLSLKYPSTNKRGITFSPWKEKETRSEIKERERERATKKDKKGRKILLHSSQ